MKKSIHSREYGIFLDELRRVREESGISQIELAEKLGSTQSIVSKCERGERRLDLIELWRWLKALGGDLPAFSQRLDRRLGGKR